MFRALRIAFRINQPAAQRERIVEVLRRYRGRRDELVAGTAAEVDNLAWDVLASAATLIAPGDLEAFGALVRTLGRRTASDASAAAEAEAATEREDMRRSCDASNAAWAIRAFLRDGSFNGFDLLGKPERRGLRRMRELYLSAVWAAVGEDRARWVAVGFKHPEVAARLSKAGVLPDLELLGPLSDVEGAEATAYFGSVASRSVVDLRGEHGDKAVVWLYNRRLAAAQAAVGERA